jgi:hypothetical protein
MRYFIFSSPLLGLVYRNRWAGHIAHMRKKANKNNYQENQVRDYLENLCADRRIILNWIV